MNTPEDIAVMPAVNNGAVITFSAEDSNTVYRLYRTADKRAEGTLVGEFPGGSDVRAWDNANVGQGCYYYIVATRPSVQVNGAAIESEPSAYVFYAPSQGYISVEPEPSPEPAPQPSPSEMDPFGEIPNPVPTGELVTPPPGYPGLFF